MLSTEMLLKVEWSGEWQPEESHSIKKKSLASQSMCSDGETELIRGKGPNGDKKQQTVRGQGERWHFSGGGEGIAGESRAFAVLFIAGALILE